MSEYNETPHNDTNGENAGGYTAVTSGPAEQQNGVSQHYGDTRGSGKTTYMHGQKFAPAHDEESERPQVQPQERGAKEETSLLGKDEETAGAATLPPGEDPYGDFAIPEELQVNEEILDAFKGVASELRLDRGQAQKLVDLQTRHAMQQVEQFREMRRNWVHEISSDPEYGGHRLDSTIRSANSVLQRYDPQGELKHELNMTGYGDNPKIIRLLARIGRDLQEDTVVQGRGASARNIPLRDRLWPDEVMP